MNQANFKNLSEEKQEDYIDKLCDKYVALLDKAEDIWHEIYRLDEKQANEMLEWVKDR